MTKEALAEAIEQLRGTYGLLSTGGTDQTLIRIKAVSLPKGCTPTSTPVLVVTQDGQRPLLYVKGGITLPNGRVPRNYSANQVGAEEWWSFSYSFGWDESNHTLVQFVEASLRRFAKAD